MNRLRIVLLVMAVTLAAPYGFAAGEGDAPANPAAAETLETSVPQSPPSREGGPASGEIGENVRMDQIGNILLVFLVLATLFEVALTPLFNWTPFLARFEGKGVKTPIVTGLAFLVFWGYDLDIIRDLLVAMGARPGGTPPGFGGQILTALLIAGGSDGVFRIFSKLGIRNPTERKDKAKVAAAALAGQPGGRAATTTITDSSAPPTGDSGKQG